MLYYEEKPTSTLYKKAILKIRLLTSLAFRQTLTDAVLGETPHTDEYGSDPKTFVETPVHIVSFGGKSRSFPMFKVSAVLTAVVTVAILNVRNPVTPQDLLKFTQVSALPAAGSMPSHPPLLPDEQRRFDRAERLYSAASDMREAEPSVSSSAPAVPVIRSDNKVGVYLTAASVGREQFLDDTVDELLKSGATAVIFDVKGSGVLFHSAAPMANDTGLVRPMYDLPAIIAKLKEKNIYVSGRFVAIKDDALTRKLPDTKIRHPKTGKVLSQKWVDPANDTVIEFNTQVICELAEAGIDEINMDYIRFSTAEFGALMAYSAEEKADRVETFIRATRETVDRCGPETKLGLSTYAILGWDYDKNVETLGQDVKRFAPLVDVISPMAYPATFTSEGYYVPGKHPGPRNYYLVYRTLTGYAELLGPEESKKLRPWIQGYGVTTKDVSDQIRAVYDAGLCGYTVWNAGNNYAPTYAAMQADTLRPERCL